MKKASICSQNIEKVAKYEDNFAKHKIKNFAKKFRSHLSSAQLAQLGAFLFFVFHVPTFLIKIYMETTNSKE